MTKTRADEFLNEQLQRFMEKAKSAGSDEELIRFTDEAHKLYITLCSTDGFEDKESVINSGIRQ